MGNVTGFASGLPIEYGDDVVVIPLRMTSDDNIHDPRKSGAMYITDFLCPYFLPLFGKYDTYNKVYDIETNKITDYIEKFFGLPIETFLKSILQNVNSNEIERRPINNDKLFNELAYGIEHRSFYEKICDMDMPIIKELGIDNYILDKLGCSEQDDGSWKVPGLNDVIIRVNRLGSSLIVEDKIEEINYGYELIERLIELGADQTKFSKDIFTISKYEKSYDYTMLKIEESEKLPLEKRIFGLEFPEGNNRYITSYIDKTSLSGEYLHRFDSRNMPCRMLKTASRKEVIDFVKFYNVLQKMGICFTPSNVVSDDFSHRLIYDVMKIKKDIHEDKIDDILEDVIVDEDDDLYAIKKEMKEW